MKALILDNQVVDVSQTEFPVAPDMSWIEAPDNCTLGWTLVGGVLTAPPEPKPKTYDILREKAYPKIGDQLDDLYHAGVFSADMIAKLKKVKSDNPKSE